MKKIILALFILCCDKHTTAVSSAQEMILKPSSQSTATSSTISADKCGSEMLHVEGDYCPRVEEICLKWLDKDQSKTANGGMGPLRCAEFKYPTKCLSHTLKSLNFCMDKFEWPNKPGTLPEVGFDWNGATARCSSVGKRLCNEDEWNFAAEGPQMNPYPTGYKRDYSCNIDKPWLDYKKYNRSNWNLIYQGVASDPDSKCKSWSGVINLSGNVDEIINRPHGKAPYRNESTGGYWGPVRGRVRPKTQVHSELFSDYQLGTRCCKDTK